MKATPLAAFAALVFAALCAFLPAPASAQGRDNAYVVSGVMVDETAANSAEAQRAGFASAQRLGFQRLVRRLTLPADEARLGMPQIDGAALERLVLSVDVQEERRSGTRYIGRLAVRFDPSGVRTLLRNAGYAVVDTRTGSILAVPVTASGVPEETALLWRQVWEQGGFRDELAPLSIAAPGLADPPDWNAARSYAQLAGATTALYATLRIQGQTASAVLVELGEGGVRRDRGEVAARIGAPGDAAALRATLANLAEQANLRIQNDWKARIAAGSGQRARVSASALYADQRQWEQIKSGLEGAAATLISEIRIEAVGREGALVSFSFTGERAQLSAELRRRGVSLEESSAGPILRVAR